MIVERWTHTVKAGRIEEAIELLRSHNWRRPYRLFRSKVGVMRQLITEAEFESMAEIEQSWNEIESAPEFESFIQKWAPLIVSTERDFLTPIETSR
jgi:hypothetical protein